jgi:hypothetical protein
VSSALRIDNIRSNIDANIVCARRQRGNCRLDGVYVKSRCRARGNGSGCWSLTSYSKVARLTLEAAEQSRSLDLGDLSEADDLAVHRIALKRGANDVKFCNLDLNFPSCSMTTTTTRQVAARRRSTGFGPECGEKVICSRADSGSRDSASRLQV